MEEWLTPTKDCPVFRTQTIRVPEGLTRAEQQAFMDRYEDRQDHEIWRIFIVGMPADPIARRLGDVNA
jgi:hypothetical protein